MQPCRLCPMIGCFLDVCWGTEAALLPGVASAWQYAEQEQGEMIVLAIEDTETRRASMSTSSRILGMV